MAEKEKPAAQDQMLQQLGNRIRSIRESKGYTNHETFANDHHLNRVQYWRCESGYDITFETLLKIIAALDMTLQEFFSEGFD